MTNPVAVVEIWRGTACESRHEVDLVVASASDPVEVWGEADRLVIPRSAIKSIQALPLVTTGAADAFAVTDDELALACASHSGEPRHVEAVQAWLARLGLSAADLECGPDQPLGRDAQKDFHRGHGTDEAIFNCCSGKHAGFLTTARHLGIDTAGYIAAEHPIQQMVAEAVANLTGDVTVPAGIDGCGIPVHAIALRGLAAGMARLADPSEMSAEVAAAARRLTTLLPTRGFWVSGTDRFETRLESVAVEPVVAKTGAEGVFMGALPNQGLGFAVKARDGATRAAEAALDALLNQLRVTDASVIDPVVANKAGTATGEVVVHLA